MGGLVPVNGPGVSEKMNISPCSTRCCPSGYYAAGKQPLALLHGIFFLIFSKTPGVYKPPAVPSGSAQGAHYPAGTRRDIQAVTGSGFEIMSHDHHDDVRRTRRLSLGSARRPGGPAARVSWRPCQPECKLRLPDRAGRPGPASGFASGCRPRWQSRLLMLSSFQQIHRDHRSVWPTIKIPAEAESAAAPATRQS